MSFNKDNLDMIVEVSKTRGESPGELLLQVQYIQNDRPDVSVKEVLWLLNLQSKCKILGINITQDDLRDQKDLWRLIAARKSGIFIDEVTDELKAQTKNQFYSFIYSNRREETMTCIKPSQPPMSIMGARTAGIEPIKTDHYLRHKEPVMSYTREELLAMDAIDPEADRMKESAEIAEDIRRKMYAIKNESVQETVERIANKTVEAKAIIEAAERGNPCAEVSDEINLETILRSLNPKARSRVREVISVYQQGISNDIEYAVQYNLNESQMDWLRRHYPPKNANKVTQFDKQLERHHKISQQFRSVPPITDKAKGTENFIRVRCCELAMFVSDELAEGPEKELALLKIREAYMWATASVWRREL